MCEMGWVGLRAPEAEGGAGLGMAAFCALAEELGAALVPEPLIPAAFAAQLLRGPALAAQLAGERLVLPALEEKPQDWGGTAETRLRDGRLSGRKVFVPMAAGADAFLVSAREGLALVAAEASGVRLETQRTQDGGHFGTLLLENAPAEPVAGELGLALEDATLATAAYLLGLMDRVFAITLDYLKTRQQFGRVIGTYQVLQHRAVDLKIQLALTRASVESAAALCDDRAPSPLRSAAVSRAKARASDAALYVTRQAIQLHGGIGYTDECDAGLFLRKAVVMASQFGAAALHRKRFAALAPESDDE
jgi:alkylation response protein AidB-like acyl-CoA dehydrogenase